MKIGIVGMGMMGGSFGRMLLKNTDHVVYGDDRSEEVLKKAFSLKAMHERLTTENAGDLDLIIFSVYPRGFEEAARRYLPYLKDGAIVMDFCGIKRPIHTAMEKMCKEYPSLRFVGGHPMAGREFWGINHAVTTLFDRASLLFVPVAVSLKELVALQNFFLSVGFLQVFVTTDEIHDKKIALTSQLAHVVSSAYVKSPNARIHVGFSAGSFQDMTRVAKLNPDMWTELMTDNADYLVEELDGFMAHLSEYRDALAARDENTLRKLLKEGAKIKERLDKEK